MLRHIFIFIYLIYIWCCFSNCFCAGCCKRSRSSAWQWSSTAPPPHTHTHRRCAYTCSACTREGGTWGGALAQPVQARDGGAVWATRSSTGLVCVSMRCACTVWQHRVQSHCICVQPPPTHTHVRALSPVLQPQSHTQQIRWVKLKSAGPLT